MLMRLIYASEVAQPLGPAELNELLLRARRNNARRDITGMLLFDSRCFLQLLEGGREVLSDLYTRLAQDPRHHRLVLLGCEPIAQRRFDAWDMGFAAADASHATLYRRHSAARQLDPQQLTGASALALLAEFAQGPQAIAA